MLATTTLVGVLLPLVGSATGASAASTLVVGPGGGAGACASPTYLTISAAVGAASAGDSIRVCPGTYTENVNDGGKALIFEGAQAGVDARTRSGPESTVNGGGGTAFTLSAGSSLDGFAVTGATNAPDTPAVFLGTDGESVSNTVFTGNNAASIITASNATFTHNKVVGASIGTADGGFGFFFNSGGGSGSRVTGNAFSGNLNQSAINVADSDPAHVAEDLRINDNTADTSVTGNFAVLGGTTHLLISGNTVTGGANSGTGILLLGDDSDFTISNNAVSGLDASAVSLAGGFGYQDNGSGSITQNSFKNNLRGVNVTSDTGTVEVHGNILVGNTTGGTPDNPNAAVRNTTTTASVQAQDNFYGCNTGPGTAGCDAVLGPVTSTPYLVLSSQVADGTLAVGESTTFTVDLNHRNDGTLTATTAPAGEPVTFTFDKGTVSPASSTLGVSGTATTTVTATAAGTGTVTGKVDNAMSSKKIQITASTKPRVTIHDTSTAEGMSGTHLVYFRVTLNKKANGPVSVKYTTANGSATSPSDYRTTSGTLTVPAGATSGRIGVMVVGDKAKEANESFSVTIFTPTNATIADPVGQAVIRNDDK